MRCKYCNSVEELKWPENYKKGDKPINAETSQPHVCESKPSQKEKPTMHYCGDCHTPLTLCGCENCFHIQIPCFCPTCNTHPVVSYVK